MMIKNKKYKILLPLLSAITILTGSGCWDRKELNEIGIVTAAGIDLGPTEEELTYIYQIINPSSVAGKGFSSMKVPFIIRNTTGKTGFEATARANREIPRQLYYDHVQVFLISYDYATKKGIKDIMDGLNRDHEIRENLYLLIARDAKTEKILSSLTTLENFNGVYIKNVLINSYEHESATRPIELREAVAKLSSKATSLTLPLVDIANGKNEGSLNTAQTTNNEAIIQVEGFAVFKKDKIIGTIDYLEALALNCITDKLRRTVCVVSYKGGNHSIELMKSKTKMKAEFKNGKPIITLDVKHKAEVKEINSSLDLSDPKVIKALEKATDEKINRGITKLIKRAQEEWDADIFGFGEALSKANPDEWRKMENNWEEYFKDLKVEVKVNTSIQVIGIKNKSFLKGMNGG